MTYSNLKDVFKNSLIYYYTDLRNKGCNDPLKVVISDFLDTVDMQQNQKDYISNHFKNTNDDIDGIIILLKRMKALNEIDTRALDLIIKKLNKIKV